MTYKIIAKRGKKTMPIKLESKHNYLNLDEIELDLYKPNTLSDPDPDTLLGCAPNKSTIKIFHNTNNLYIAQGTHEDQRIGNKVNVKGVNMVLNLRFIPGVIATYLSHSEAVKMSFNFRIMTVKFERQMTTTDIARWWQATYIYYRLINLTGGDKGTYQSNWMDKKRESTPWTGSFTIIKEKKFVMDKEHTVAQINYDLKFNKDVNFDNTSNNPTDNQYFSNIYSFIIGPSNMYLDMDAVSCSKISDLSTGSVPVWRMGGNIKTIYYDM